MTFLNLVRGVAKKLKLLKNAVIFTKKICNTKDHKLAAIVQTHKSLLPHKELYQM